MPRPIATRRQLLAGLAATASGFAVGRNAWAGLREGRAALLDPARLEATVEKARSFDQLHSLTIARAGETVFAEAIRGPALNRVVNVKSVSKTIVATLVGIAIDRGVLTGIDQRFVEIAPGLVPDDADPRVGALTIGHLLTMQAGLERTSGPNYGRWVQSRNWIAFALSRPFIDEPGGRMLYSTGSYHLLGAALATAAGDSLLTLARDWLGEPLGIEIAPWTRDPQGFYMGGNNMGLTPAGLLRFGELHRNGGVWDGAQIVSKAWIDAAWTRRTRSPFSGDAYGYGWFLTRLAGEDVAYARGYGGQMIYIVPGRDLTVVVTSDPNRPARSQGYAGDLKALLAEFIIPAAT